MGGNKSGGVAVGPGMTNGEKILVTTGLFLLGSGALAWLIIVGRVAWNVGGAL